MLREFAPAFSLSDDRFPVMGGLDKPMKRLSAATAAFMCLVLSGCYGGGAQEQVADVANRSAVDVIAGLTVEPLAIDVKTRYCVPQDRVAVWRINTGVAFWTLFPRALDAPELRDATVPLVVVAYATRFPGPLAGHYGMTPPPKESGSWDVCVETDDGSDGIVGQPVIVYGDVAGLDSALGIAPSE